MYSTKQVDNPETKIPFPEMPSYKIIDHLYDAQKDFIILGLCGKTGSGVSTAASLLEKEFQDLNLPIPGYDNTNLIENHEYRILHAYAKENWKSFYRIDVSSLITLNILQYESSDFISFIQKIKNDDCKEIECINNFYNKSFPFDIPKDGEISYKSLRKELTELKKGSPKNNFVVDIKEKIINIDNKSLAYLFNIYVDKRKKKSGFENPIIYTILKEYIYDLLPDTTKTLWSNLSEGNKSLPTKALQCLGNNLRIFKNPFGEGDFSEDAYTYIAEEINSAIKLLSAFNYYKNSQDKTEAISKKDKIRTMITVDSIKNPYESLYLKQRYNNYFLLGIYTEENERRERLRETKKWNDNEIDEVDSVEQISKLKEYIKNKLKNEEKQNNQELQKKPENEKKKVDKSISLIDVFLKLSDGKISPEEFLCISPFISQNISKCLESADILINNDKDTSSLHIMKKTLLRYVSLIMNPAIVLPTNVERCMQIAQTAKINSGCISRQVGAVLTDSKYHLLSIGWNQQPENQLPCSYRDICEVCHHWSTMSYSDYENDDSDKFQKGIKEQVEKIFDSEVSPFKHFGKIPCYCFKDYQNSIDKNSNQVHTRALHAEETAFLQLGPNNFRANNGFLFTTSSPCELCSKKARFLNIAKIYYIESYPGVSQKHVINIGEEKTRPELVLFTGAIGSAYTKLYTPLIARKDENEMLLGQKMSTELCKNNEEKEKEDKNEKDKKTQ